MLVDTSFNVLPWQECGHTMVVPWYYYGTTMVPMMASVHGKSVVRVSYHQYHIAMP